MIFQYCVYINQEKVASNKDSFQICRDDYVHRNQEDIVVDLEYFGHTNQGVSGY